MDFSSEPLGGGAGVAAITGATGSGRDLHKPCFLAAGPHAATGGRLCLETPATSSPVCNNAADAAGEAIESVKGAAGEAADSAVEALGTAKDNRAEAIESALGSFCEAKDKTVEGAKSAGESVVDTA
ncbi:unnamed protein product [Alopecurus aequalis]